MKLGLLSLTLSLFISSTLHGNISSIENNLIYSMFSSNQDTTSKDSISIFSASNISKDKFKSPVKAMLYSAVLPGLGQVYMEKWKRGLIYLLIEGVSAGVWYQKNVLAEERKKDYIFYEGDHWNFALWIRDYYKWYPSSPPAWFSGDDSLWDSIREVFVNNTDDDCTDTEACYIDIWDHSHSVDFTWDGETISSSDENRFKDLYRNLCDTQSSERVCNSNIDEISDAINTNEASVNKDHDFYEGIQKYDMFFAGWDDTDSVEVIDSGNNNNNVTSPHQSTYQSIWSDYNHIKTLAGRGGKFMFINRFVSVIDGLFLAKKWNTEHAIMLNLNVYPDLRNTSGVGGVKLTMRWK